MTSLSRRESARQWKFCLQFRQDEGPCCPFVWGKWPRGNRVAAGCRAPILAPEATISASLLRGVVYCSLGQGMTWSTQTRSGRERDEMRSEMNLVKIRVRSTFGEISWTFAAISRRRALPTVFFLLLLLLTFMPPWYIYTAKIFLRIYLCGIQSLFTEINFTLWKWALSYRNKLHIPQINFQIFCFSQYSFHRAEARNAVSLKLLEISSMCGATWLRVAMARTTRRRMTTADTSVGDARKLPWKSNWFSILKAPLRLFKSGPLVILLTWRYILRIYITLLYCTRCPRKEVPPGFFENASLRFRCARMSKLRQFPD